MNFEGPDMSINPEMATKLAELKKQLEEIAGQEIEVSAELLDVFFPVGSALYEENSQVTRYRIILPGGVVKSCLTPVTLLDASGRSSTGSDGKGVFLLSKFICSSLNSFSEPVFLLATPHVTNPCYTTMTHEIVPDANNPGFNDVQITAYTWGPNGTPAPNISFDWRCRVVSNPIIFGPGKPAAPPRA
jgi:hypothetical protein